MTILRKNSLSLTVELNAGIKQRAEQFTRQSELYKSVLQDNNIFEVLQKLRNNLSYGGIVFQSYYKRSHSQNFRVYGGYDIVKASFLSALTAFDSVRAPRQLPTGIFTNNLLDKRNILYAGLEYTKSGRVWNNQYSYSINNLFYYYNLRVIYPLDPMKSLKSVFHWQPGITASIGFKNKIKASLSATLNSNLPKSAYAYNGLILNRFTNFESGVDSLITYTTPAISFILNRQFPHVTTTLTYSYSSSSKQLSSTFSNNGLFTFLSLAYLPQNSDQSFLHSSIIWFKKSRTISFDINFAHTQSNYIINQIYYKYQYGGNNNTLTFKDFTHPKLTHEFTASTDLLRFKQHSDNATFTGKNFNLSLVYELKMVVFKTFTAQLTQKYISLTSSTTPSEKYAFTDAKVAKAFKSGRLSAYIECRNTFNKYKYSTIISSVISQVNTYTEILPRIILAGIEYKF